MAQMEMCGFQGSGTECDCVNVAPHRNRVYIRIQPRNSSIRDLLVKEFRRRNVDVVEPPGFGQSLAAVHVRCYEELRVLFSMLVVRGILRVSRFKQPIRYAPKHRS